MPETQRHPTLPQNLSETELSAWIKRVKVEQFTESQKKYFTPEEIQEFEHESAINGRWIDRLKSLVKEASEAATNGNDEDVVIVIPACSGTKFYDKTRSQNYELIERGYEEIETEVFGIVNRDNGVMEYFTITGVNIEERTRPLSAKEKQQYLLSSLDGGAKLMIDDRLTGTGF